MSLVDVLNDLDIDADIDLEGRWVRIRGANCAVYIAELPWDRGLYMWCDHPAERAVQFYRDPYDAIRSGLKRAEHPGG